MKGEYARWKELSRVSSNGGSKQIGFRFPTKNHAPSTDRAWQYFLPPLRIATAARPSGRNYFLPLGSLSSAERPRNSRRPSANVTFLPTARVDPSLAWYPSTIISAPGGSESLVNPSRYRLFGLPPSIIQVTGLPSSPLTSMWIQECGLLTSHL